MEMSTGIKLHYKIIICKINVKFIKKNDCSDEIDSNIKILVEIQSTRYISINAMSDCQFNRTITITLKYNRKPSPKLYPKTEPYTLHYT